MGSRRSSSIAGINRGDGVDGTLTARPCRVVRLRITFDTGTPRDACVRPRLSPASMPLVAPSGPGKHSMSETSPPRPAEPSTEPGDVPRYRPRERFWPYVDLTEHPTAEELAALD